MKKNTLIIGGSSDIGKKLISKIDYNKFGLVSTYNKTKIEVKNTINLKLNVTSIKSIKKFTTSLKKLKIKFDYLIFLQGELHGKNLQKFSYTEIKENFNKNILSSIILIKELDKLFKDKCLIIFVSSISAVNGSFDPIYSSSKSAITGLFKSLSKWESPKKRFICLCPGPIIGTKMFKNFSKKRKKFHIKNNPNKELLNVDDFAEIIKDILKPHWRHANGSLININGGVY